MKAILGEGLSSARDTLAHRGNTEQQQPAQCWFPQWEMVPSSMGPVSLTCTREECPQRITKPSHVPHTVELETSSGQQPSGLFHCTQEGSLCLQILWQEMLHRQHSYLCLLQGEKWGLVPLRGLERGQSFWGGESVMCIFYLHQEAGLEEMTLPPALDLSVQFDH